MNLYRLTAPHTVHGHDLFGRPTSVLFTPQRDTIDHWTFRKADQSVTTCIGPSLMKMKRRYIELRGKGSAMRIAEHLVPLCWVMTGVHVIPSSEWMPYVMPGRLVLPGPKESTLHSCLQPTATQPTWCPIEATCGWQYAKPRGGRAAYVKAEPIDRPTLEVIVEIDYPGLGRFRKDYDLALMRQDELIRLLTIGPQGWLRSCGMPCTPALRLALRLMRWRHRDAIVWPDTSTSLTTSQTLEAFADHRFLDILGAFGTVVYGSRFPAMRITSRCAGHLADVQVAKCIVMPQSGRCETTKLV